MRSNSIAGRPSGRTLVHVFEHILEQAAIGIRKARGLTRNHMCGKFTILRLGKRVERRTHILLDSLCPWQCDGAILEAIGHLVRGLMDDPLTRGAVHSHALGGSKATQTATLTHIGCFILPVRCVFTMTPDKQIS